MSASSIISQNTFSLCGHGYSPTSDKVAPYHNCQELLYFGCKRPHGYFNEAKGQAYVKVVRRNCGRLRCPKCLDKVTSNKARKITKRLKRWRVNRMTIKHIIVSPDTNETDGMDYPEIKKKAYKLMKRCGVLGGVMIVHPFRCNEFHRYEKPGLHFHIIGYGNVRGTGKNGTAQVYKETRWIVKNLAERKSVFVTAKYILGHCGVSEKYSTINWFGKLSYNKIRMGKHDKIPGCIYCGEELLQMAWRSKKFKPPEEKEFLDEPSNWTYVKSQYA
tara:strand:+ start:815 stop:1636 length:822 start_codon:yes stop_codon:yes gene_type:complete